MNFDDGLVIGLAYAKKKKPKVDDIYITKNGEYRAASDNLDGYDVVKVNVTIKYDSGDDTPIEIDPGDDIVTPEGIKGDKWIWKFSTVPYDADDPDSYQYVLCSKISRENPEYISTANFWVDGNVNHSYNVRIISAVKVDAGYEVTATGQDKDGHVYTSTTVFTS